MPQWIPDLFLNVISEIFGIALTVFFVAKLIQRREDTRWLPSKQFLYSRLVPHFDSVMWITVPFLMLGSKYIYEFGDAVATTLDISIDFSNPEINKEVFLKLKKYSGEISLDNKVETLKTLSQEKDEIDKVLAGSMMLIEPELASALMKLQRVLSDAENFVSTLYIGGGLTHLGSSSSVDGVFLFMYNAAEAAQKAKILVINKATNKTSAEEFALKLNKIAQQQENSRSKNGKRI